MVKPFIAVSQKGDLSDNLKIYQIKPGPVGADQTPYYIVDFRYSQLMKHTDPTTPNISIVMSLIQEQAL